MPARHQCCPRTRNEPALLVGISATWGILRLHHWTADYGAATLLVSQIETGARHHSATEWEAIAELEAFLDGHQARLDAQPWPDSERAPA